MIWITVPNQALQQTGAARSLLVGHCRSAAPAAELCRSATEGVGVRRSLEETWRFLASEGERVPRRPDGEPFVPDAMPNHNDPAGRIGFSYFKYRLEDADNSDLTLPRTFFGRSYFVRVRFANTDLTESRMCWNDFVDCDFGRADLSRCDMRASRFKGCSFAGAILRDADLRGSSFAECVFAGADLAGAVADDDVYTSAFSDEQYERMVWHEDVGEQAPGG